MSSLDIYDDTENIISSDEYSEEDDDELMNAAISTHHSRRSENSDSYYNRPPPTQRKQPAKEPRLPFKRKLCSKYKARSLKWLNGKAKREKSKQYLLCLKRRETSPSATHKRKEEIDDIEDDDCKGNTNLNNVAETIDLDESDIEYSSPIKCKDEVQKKDSKEEIKEIVKDPKVEIPEEKLDENPKEVAQKQKEIDRKQKEIAEKQKEIDARQREIAERQAELSEKQKETTEKSTAVVANTVCVAAAISTSAATEESNNIMNAKKSQKRTRSISPERREEEEKEGNANKKQQPERPTSAQLYRQINEMFPKYDAVVSNHVKHNSTTMEAIDDNMTRLMQDIQTLNDILQAKETEWNRLLNLKRVKEEILGRLARKKHILNNIQERKFEEQKYNLPTLKELEMYLSVADPQSRPMGHNIGLSTAHQIIENRASMKTEELEKERNNTNRLQNLLISSNILQRVDASSYEYNNNTAKPNNLSPIHNTAFNDNDNSAADLQKYQYLEQKIKSKTAGRQGPLIDVKSIVADFRQQNPIVFPRVGKRIKANDANYNMRALSTSPNCVDTNSGIFMETYNGNGSNYAPTLEKLLSTSSRNNTIHQHGASAAATQGFKFNRTENQKSYYRLQSDDGCNEISITPVNCINRYPQRVPNSKSGLLRTALDNSHHNDYYEVSDYIKASHKSNRDMRNNNDSQLCQECNMNEARFVCAGCGNQWYCSRECQVNAWDKHSEVCSE